MKRQWQIKPAAPSDFFNQFPEIDRLVLQLLWNRDLKTKEEIEYFLEPLYDQQILDPFLFKDMTKAVERIFRAIHNQEKVLVYGDYDADGVCATAIMHETLKSLGLEVEIYIPFRETEGYGLNQKISEQLADQGYDLLITVDCGISNQAEIAFLNKKGVEIIIVDHHQAPSELPSALAILNPALTDSGYPFGKLCGAGVAFKLVQAIIIKQNEKDQPLKLPTGFDKWLLDLVAIATIGDICPLIKENRILTKYGLLVLRQTKHLGLKKLIQAINSQNEIDSQYVGWRLAPRLNAAGRIDHASISFKLLTAGSEIEAERLVELLEKNNKLRQQLTDRILQEATAQLGEIDRQKILIAVGQNWPPGVVGLIAGRLSDRHHRPTLIIGQEGDKYVGSGRSIERFDITQALAQCREFLARFGGHSQACGFTVLGKENFKNFEEKIKQLAEARLKIEDLAPVLEAEAVVKLKEANWDLWEGIKQFAPFGEGNGEPVFAAFNLRIEQLQTVGSEGQHLKLSVGEEGNNKIYKLIGFSLSEQWRELKIGDKIDIVFELGVNEWNGNRELQFKIVDLKL